MLKTHGDSSSSAFNAKRRGARGATIAPPCPHTHTQSNKRNAFANAEAAAVCACRYSKLWWKEYTQAHPTFKNRPARSLVVQRVLCVLVWM